MEIGVLTVPFASKPLSEVLPYLRSLGVKAVELGTGGVTNKSHCAPEAYLGHPEEIEKLKCLLKENDIRISALSCHGNPVHPDPAKAAADHQAFVDTVKLAQDLGVDTVVTFSGCPGDSDCAVHPNWVTCAWPEEFQEILDYQWNEILIPYWKKAAQIAKDAGVRVAIEMHPRFCVYNTETMLKLRKETDDVLGANFDPSHLFWQGMNAADAIRELGDAIHYVHAKDCQIDENNVHRIGVMDTKHYSDIPNRAWTFRTVGYGHDEAVWKEIVSNLKLNGYDGVISIEHEDALMSVKEGLEKAVAFLSGIVIREQPEGMWWA